MVVYTEPAPDTTATTATTFLQERAGQPFSKSSVVDVVDIVSGAGKPEQKYSRMTMSYYFVINYISFAALLPA
jgi:hypothetical protein